MAHCHRAKFYLKVSDFFITAGLVAVFEIIKAARLGAGTMVDHMLSTVTFIVALVEEFLLVPFCGTAAFFFS
jgi:hypothetical protein